MVHCGSWPIVQRRPSRMFHQHSRAQQVDQTPNRGAALSLPRRQDIRVHHHHLLCAAHPRNEAACGDAQAVPGPAAGVPRSRHCCILRPRHHHALRQQPGGEKARWQHRLMAWWCVIDDHGGVLVNERGSLAACVYRTSAQLGPLSHVPCVFCSSRHNVGTGECFMEKTGVNMPSISGPLATIPVLQVCSAHVSDRHLSGWRGVTVRASVGGSVAIVADRHTHWPPSAPSGYPFSGSAAVPRYVCWDPDQNNIVADRVAAVMRVAQP